MKLGELISVRKGKKPQLIVGEAAPGYRRLIQIDDLRPGAEPKFCPPARDEVVAESFGHHYRPGWRECWHK